MVKRKIIGRKVPTDIKRWGLIKNQIILLKNLGEYNHAFLYYGLVIPTEIFETWELVYEVEEKIFKMGLSLKSEIFVLKVKKGKCFYGKNFEKDVTLYVEGLIDRHRSSSFNIVGEKCTVDEITFSETLEPILTTYDQWEEVFNYMIEQRQES